MFVPWPLFFILHTLAVLADRTTTPCCDGQQLHGSVTSLCTKAHSNSTMVNVGRVFCFPEMR